MMKKYRTTLIITTALLLLPMAVGLFLWSRLPERVPSHFNAEGVVDGWSSKAMAVFGIPGILLGAHLLCALATLADPKRRNVGSRILTLVLWIVPVLSLVLNGIVYMTALGKQVDINLILGIFMGVLFIGIGNYLPKCKQNYTVGIKLPWTLDSEENWNRTHRMAGWLWTVCGGAVLLAALLWPEGFLWIMLAAIGCMVLPPMVYSYVLYKKGV